jgi:hypothetical protein
MCTSIDFVYLHINVLFYCVLILFYLFICLFYYKYSFRAIRAIDLPKEFGRW